MFELSPRKHKVLVAASIALLASVLSLSLVAAALVTIDTDDGAIVGWPPAPSAVDPPSDASSPTLDIVEAWIGTDAPVPTEFYFRIDVLAPPAPVPGQIPMVQLDCDLNGSFSDPVDRGVEFWLEKEVSDPPLTVIVRDGFGTIVTAYLPPFAEQIGLSAEWKALAPDLGLCATAGSFGVMFVTNFSDDATDPFVYEQPTAVTLTGFQQRASIVPFLTAGLSGLGLSTVLVKRKEQR